MGRTILVVEEHPYLWAVLQGRIQPGTAYVRSATPEELPATWQSCRPWPWLVVGAMRTVPDGLVKLVGARPIAVHWLGEPPAALASRAIGHPSWMALAAELERLNDLAEQGLHGVRLMRNRGLMSPDGQVILDVAEVEGLLAAPDGLPVPADSDGDRVLSALRDEIDAHRLPLRLERDGDLVRLA